MSSDNFYYRKDRSGENRHRIDKCEYISFLSCVADFEIVLFHIALCNGYGKYWTSTMWKNMYSFAKAMLKSDEAKYIPWIADICKNQMTDVIMKSCVSSVPARKTFGNGVVNLRTYLNNNKNNIDYPTYEQKGYFDGSGAIESGNKIAVQYR